MTTASIGIFDSGLGGLTVMKTVKNLLPHENIVYFGDTRNLPYGSKDKDTIVRYALAGLEFLISLQVKLIVIACHTVCTVAYSELAQSSSVPLIGMIEPSLELLKTTKSGSLVALLGTSATIRSGLYQRKILEQRPDIEIMGLACPSFVPLIEEGYAAHPLAKITIHNELQEVSQKQVDIALLACTHFPLVHDLIQKEFPKETKIADPAIGCAYHTKRHLEQENLLNHQKTTPKYTFFVSGNPKVFSTLGESFLGQPIPLVLPASSTVG